MLREQAPAGPRDEEGLTIQSNSVQLPEDSQRRVPAQQSMTPAVQRKDYRSGLFNAYARGRQFGEFQGASMKEAIYKLKSEL